MSRPAETLTWMRAYLGLAEGPNNAQPFAAMVGHTPNLAWCSTFRVAGHKSTGVSIPAGGATASSMTNYYAYKRAGLLVDANDIQPGDIYWVASRNAATATNQLGINHEATVLQRLDGTRFVGIDGNWGDKVATPTRDYALGGASRIIGFARPQWTGQPVAIYNLPADRDTITMVNMPAVPSATQGAPVRTGLVADGVLGPATIRALQSALGGLAVDGEWGPATTRALQAKLNKAIGAKLAVDGVFGPASVRALQAYLGTPRDGVISRPVSTVIKVLQQRLSAATF